MQIFLFHVCMYFKFEWGDNYNHNIDLVWFMVFNATFNNILVISWRLVLFVEETWVLWENHKPVTSHWQTLSHNVSSTPRPSGIRTHNFSSDRHWLQVAINPTTIRSWPPRSLQKLVSWLDVVCRLNSTRPIWSFL